MFCNHDLLFLLPDNEECDPCNLYVSQLLKKKQRTPGNSPEGHFRHLTMMTVNVLSLFAGTDEKVGSGNYVSARMEAIATQCQQKGSDIIGLQET